MSDKTFFDPEKISLTEFKIIRGQIETPEDFSVEKVEGHQIENRFLLSFSLEDKMARADFSIEVKTDSNGRNTNEAVGNFNFVFIFHIENLDQLAKENSEQKTVDTDFNLAMALASISYSTSRGILLTRFQGTAMQNFILPVINVDKLLQ